MASHLMEQDDIFERYDVPASNSKDFSRASLTRSSPRNMDKGFLSKYGVGIATSGFHSSKGGDTTNPSYWLRRMGLIELSSASSGKHSRAACSSSSSSSGPSGSVQQVGAVPRDLAHHSRVVTGSGRTSSRRRQQRAALASAVANKVAGGPVISPVGGPTVSPLWPTEPPAVALLSAGSAPLHLATGGPLTEALESALMREVLLAGRSAEGPCFQGARDAGARSERSGSEDGSWYAARLESRQESKVGSENGDSSWSLASGTSSFSILSSLNLETLSSEPNTIRPDTREPPLCAARPLQGRGYRTVLLQSDSEQEL